ncbi:MAG: flagellar basal body P-ring formation protein FlgA [Alphaproteobacteria bacterium]|nr:flagellar basal body P-ring formation protein FlgA [Alphaproteobacteria bacterium]
MINCIINIKTFIFLFVVFCALALCNRATFAYTDTSFVQKEAGVTLKSSEVSINHKINIEEEHITLGDVFNGITLEKQGELIAYAPEPGQKLVLTAKWLNSLALKYAISWRASSIYDKIVVSRASDIISEKDIQERLREALMDQGVDESSEIAFNKSQILIHVPVNSATEILVNTLDVMGGGQRFTSVIDIKAGGDFSKQIRISGRIFNVIDVPVLHSNMQAGDAISKDDIVWKAVRERHVRNDTMLSEDDLIGMEARRLIRKETLIKTTDVRKHVAVKKGKRVQIVLANKGMTLTVVGEALENGSLGEIIRIKNIQSKKTIYATVMGDDMLAIEVAARPSMMQTSMVIN